MKVFAYRDNLARGGHTVGCRREQRKLHRPPERQIELPAADLHLLAFFLTPGNQAKGFRFVFAFKTDIERVGGATTNTAAHPAADQCVIGGATGNRQIQRSMLEDPDRTVAPMPCRNRFDEPFRNADGGEYPS